MNIWDAKSAQLATGGKLIGPDDWNVSSISIDSRTTRKGDLFIALRGNKADGHDYIREAFLKGAAAVMVERLPDNFPKISPVLMVDDCIKALEDLAQYRRAESKAKIIAVTGSVGKTSTKEMLNIVFSSFGMTHATLGNNNNEIGVPLSLAKMPLDTEFGIFEIGMNHPGEIAPLAKMVQPHVAIITNIAENHIEFFHNQEGIAVEKASIFEGLQEKGTAIINQDSEFFKLMRKTAKENGAKEVTSFGEEFESDIRLVSHDSSASGGVVHAKVGFDEISYHISARGKHMAINSLAVLAAVEASGNNAKQAAEALSSFSAQKGRGQILNIERKGGKVLIIDESYNASPVSVKAALSNLGDLQVEGRKIAVIGDMLELGEKSEAMHRALVNDIIHDGIDLVYTVGEMSEKIFLGLPQEIQGFAAKTVDELTPIIDKEIQPKDALLVKASNGIGLAKLIEEISKSSLETV